jgi:hypothetical protein
MQDRRHLFVTLWIPASSGQRPPTDLDQGSELGSGGMMAALYNCVLTHLEQSRARSFVGQIPGLAESVQVDSAPKGFHLKASID